MASQSRARTRFTSGIAVAIAGLLAACPAPRPDLTAPQPQPMPALKIMPLGDSITDGYNVPGGYRVKLYRELRDRGYAVDFVGSQRNGLPELPEPEHEGHSGWKIGQIHLRVTGWLRAAEPEIILLTIGTNDILQGDRLETAPKRLAALLETIYAELPAVDVFVASIPPIADAAFDARVQAYNAAIPAIVEQQQAAGRAVRFVDVYSALNWDDLADGVHPNQRGHNKMAVVWLEALLAARSPD